MEQLLTLNEITLIPNDISSVLSSNNKVNYNFSVNEQADAIFPNTLPIITSPLSMIVGQDNYKIWQKSGIRPIIPRIEPIDFRLSESAFVFSAFTLSEIKQYFIDKSPANSTRTQYHICFDTWNGHNSDIFNLGFELKKRYGNRVLLMGGPIANTKSYEYYSKAGFDFVRVGSRSEACPSKVDSFYFPMGSLLEGIKLFKSRAGIGLRPVKVIADGEIDDYSDILKAIALGADYVMIGQEFSRVLEAAGEVLSRTRNRDTGEFGYDLVSPELLKNCTTGWKAKLNGYCRYYCLNQDLEKQALKEGFRSVQEWKNKIGQRFNTTWETVEIDITLAEWIEKFIDMAKRAFILSNSYDWPSYQKLIKYGSFRGGV